MMARVESITSEIMDIFFISNCGLGITNYARAAFAVLPELVNIAKSSPHSCSNQARRAAPPSIRLIAYLQPTLTFGGLILNVPALINRLMSRRRASSLARRSD